MYEHLRSRFILAGLIDRATKTFCPVSSWVRSVVWCRRFLIFDWKGALGIAASAVLVSVLTSFADPKETDKAVATAPVEYEPRHAG